jgi:hypothetical protein
MIDNQDSDLVSDYSTPLYDDDQYSKIEVLWVSAPQPQGFLIGSGIDVNTQETVEWASSSLDMVFTAEMLNKDDHVYYCLVPYWQERSRRNNAPA